MVVASTSGRLACASLDAACASYRVTRLRVFNSQVLALHLHMSSESSSTLGLLSLSLWCFELLAMPMRFSELDDASF
eukprot:3737820-Amphidinium_carterae.1